MTFVVKTYDNVYGLGNLLSQASMTVTIGPNQAPIPLSLNATVAAVNLSLASSTAAASGGTTTLTVNALDPTGATIVGGGNYSVPITIVPSDPSVTVSPSTLPRSDGQLRQ